MKKVISIALALLMVAVMLPVMAMAEGTNVAKIGTTEYATLKEAFDAVPNGETIVVMKNCSGNGIVVNSGRNFTVDFNNCTYDIDGTTVGSTGTETNGFQLLKDSTITFKNGKLTSTKAKILIQNYCNLTLENMELDGRNLNRSNPNYTLSNNNGNVVIKDTTIFAAAGMVAFDVCRYADYVGPKVTVKGNSVINGKVEISSSGAKDGAQHELVIENGTFNGAIEKADESHDFSSRISGGTFNSNVTPYVNNELVVTDGSNYYVGDSAYEAVGNATSGEFTVVDAPSDESLSFQDVKPGVKIKNEQRNSGIIVNGNEVPTGGSYTVPGAPIIIYTPDNEPAFLSGANQVVAPGAAATFRIDEEYDRLLAVAVDGVTLDKSNYEAWSGSTYIKLLPKFMKTLSVGTHTLTAYFTSHTVSTTFTISEGAKNPATGANDFVGVAAAMAVVSLLGAAAVIRKK